METFPKTVVSIHLPPADGVTSMDIQKLDSYLHFATADLMRFSFHRRPYMKTFRSVVLVCYEHLQTVGRTGCFCFISAHWPGLHFKPGFFMTWFLQMRTSSSRRATLKRRTYVYMVREGHSA